MAPTTASPQHELTAGGASLRGVAALGDRDAVRAVLTLAVGSPTFLAFRCQDPVNVDTLERMRAAAGACRPAKHADAITELVIKEIRRIMFPLYG